MKLYINSHLMDLKAGSLIPQTKEINNVGEPAVRKTNGTRLFQLPKTANNLKALGFMGEPGSLTEIPYQKNECSLYNDTGECFIYKGWANVEDMGTHFECFVLDGIIDFYKEVENISLAELGLEELTHTKEVANVIRSWNEDLPYRYILADYNGDTGEVNPSDNSTPKVNIDYLVPAVKVSYLWDKMFSKFGAVYHGDVFSSYDFEELYMTYPKGLTVQGENDHEVFDSQDISFLSTANSYWSTKFNSAETDELPNVINQIHMQVGETATYRMRLRGSFKGFQDSHLSMPQDTRMYLIKNAQNEPSNAPPYSNMFLPLADEMPHGEEFDITSEIFQLQENDTVAVIVGRSSKATNGSLFGWTREDYQILHVELYRVDPNVVDFTDAFKDFVAKDFLKEIVNRFALTIFKNKYENDYTFLTLREQLKESETVDWSDKLAKAGRIKFETGTYAQRNWFRYAYNDKEGNHNDWYLDVPNKNLKDSIDIIKSKIYSPERIEVKYLNESSKKYKLWDKQTTAATADTPEKTEYTPLDKRYYFMRGVYRNKTVRVISKQLAAQDQTTTGYYRENFYKLSFYDIMADYYLPLQQIMQKYQAREVMMNLSELDVVNLDFKKLYYFKQFGAYFLLNTLRDYIPGRLTKCEFVRVVFDEIAAPPQSIAITQVEVNIFKIKVSFQLAVAVPFLQFEYKTINALTWQSVVFESATNPFPFTFQSAVPRTYLIRIKAGGIYSDEVEFQIPSNQIITI